jgi:hypothetical protein
MSLDNTTTLIASEAITEFALVSVNANGKATITDASTENNCLGIAQRACSAGDAVDVILFGKSRAIAGGNIAPATMSLLMATTNGKLIAFDGSADNYAVAQIVPNINQASAADGDQITVIFRGPSNVTSLTP